MTWRSWSSRGPWMGFRRMTSTLAASLKLDPRQGSLEVCQADDPARCLLLDPRQARNLVGDLLNPPGGYVDDDDQAEELLGPLWLPAMPLLFRGCMTITLEVKQRPVQLSKSPLSMPSEGVPVGEEPAVERPLSRMEARSSVCETVQTLIMMLDLHPRVQDPAGLVAMDEEDTLPTLEASVGFPEWRGHNLPLLDVIFPLSTLTHLHEDVEVEAPSKVLLVPLYTHNFYT